MADTLATLIVKLIADTGEMVTGVKKGSDAIDGFVATASKVAGALGIAFSVGAVVNFGRELLQTADELVKLHDRTGLSIQALQQFQVVGDDAGNTVSELTAAIVQMQNRLTSGDQSVVSALGKLGLTLAELRGLRPEDQFIAISDAIRQIEDPAAQVNIAIALFGRTGANVLPTLKKGFDDVRDGVTGMSTETVLALDDMGDAIGRAARLFKDLAGETVAFSAAPWMALLGLFRDNTTQLDDMTAAAGRTGPQLASVAPPGLPSDLKSIERELTQTAEDLMKVNLEAEKAAAKMKALQELARNRTLEMILPGQKDATLPEFRPTGAFAQVLAEETAIREQAEALALVEEQMNTNLLVVGEYANANKAAGEAVKTATNEAVIGYAAVASQVTMTGDAIRAYIDLQKFSSAANAILAENPLFTSRSQLERISKIPTPGVSLANGGGGVTVNISDSFLDTPAGVQRMAEKVGDAITRGMGSRGAGLR